MINKHMLTIMNEAAAIDALHESGSDDYNEFYDDGVGLDGACPDDDDEDVDDIDLDDSDIDDLGDELVSDFDDMDEVDDSDLDYTEEMVTVIANEAGNYYVEYDNLAKLMISKECTAVEAMEKISECNNIPLENMKLVVESDYAVKSIVEAKAISKRAKKKKAIAIKSSISLLQDVKNKGIKVVKRKGRPKGKKKNKKK